jgi:putative ABC transport system substrate-binding protein
MKRRRVLLACFALGSAPIAALAQRAAGPPRVGYLVFGTPAQGLDQAFIQGLRDLGYVEGRNIVVEYRFAERSRERLKEFAEELVRLEVEVIVAPDPPSYRAAMNATKTIPIVIRASYDPVAEGVVASLSRPGGNVTGVFSLYSDLIGKRLEILKEVIPSTSRVLALYDSRGGPAAAAALNIARKAASPLGMRLLSKDVNSAAELPAAFRAGAGARADGLLVLRAPLFVETTAQIARLAAATRLPAVYDDTAYIDAGGLMSYGPSIRGLYRQTAKYVDRILRGARPAELPVEQPTELEFIVNVRAAKALGLTIDPSVLLRADRVIE